MALLTAAITTDPLLAMVAGGGFVTVGRAVSVAAGTVGVGVSVAVGGLVSVGNALGIGNVGKGVNVPEPKLNKAVGVAPVSTLGKIFGLGTTLEELRDANGNRPIRREQRKQNTSRIRPGIRILPTWPC
jgi:hypothetical protein